jgi:hypothetical protein
MKAASFFPVCLLATLFCWSLHPVFAEIYQYTDESGKTYYTNDPLSVPDQYREDVDIQGEIVTYPGSGESEPTDESDDESATTAPNSVTPSQGNLDEVSALNAKAAAFNDEFKALQEERNELDKAMKKAESAEKVKEINAQISRFNLKYKDYTQRRHAFNEEVEKYNEQVRQDMEERLKQYNSDKAAESQSQPVQ